MWKFVDIFFAGLFLFEALFTVPLLTKLPLHSIHNLEPFLTSFFECVAFVYFLSEVLKHDEL